MRKILTFIREARAELAQVSWPTKNQVVKSTLIVIGATFVLAALLGGLDYGFGYMIRSFVIGA